MHEFQRDIDTVGRIPAVPRILEVVCGATGMGFAAVARVTGERWIACAVKDAIGFGLTPGGELKVETTICHEIRQSGEVVVIDHVSEDTVFSGHPTPAMYGFQSYISVPIVTADGAFFGTLCAIDPKPARVKTPEIIGMFKLFAELIAYHIDASDRLAASEASLLDARKTADLREQFIAVLGHDLRNPLASVDAGVRILSRSALDEKTATIVLRMRSSVMRMSGLVDNLLDFARGRLGGGIALARRDERLAPLLNQVVDELQASHPDRIIEADFELDRDVNCDPSRIGQLFSNLLGNALLYGDERPVKVEARAADDGFMLSVVNHGDPIPPATMERLFVPFARGAAGVGQQGLGQQGLGLGLYIAWEIARAHGGTLEVLSTAKETRFIFAMPLDKPTAA